MAQVVKASEEDLGWLYPGEAVEAAAAALAAPQRRAGGAHPRTGRCLGVDGYWPSGPRGRTGPGR
jgi:hypothetical protein